MARRLGEMEGYGRTGLIEPGAHQPPVTFWVPGELLTDSPTAVVEALARRGIRSRPNPESCAGLYRVEIEDAELCGPLLAADLNRVLGDEGFVGLNHVLTLAQVPKIGPGTDPEPVKEADWGCRPVELPEDWRIAVVDTGLFKDAPAHLAAAAQEWELVDFDGGGIVDFSGTAHGGFIAGIIHRMLGVAPILRDVATRDYLDWTFAITEADIISDIEHVVRDPAVKIVNLSLGTYEIATDLAALRAKMRTWVKHRPDVLFVCAAGNDATEMPFYPAAFGVEKEFADHVVAVGALDCPPDAPDARADWAEFSNRGEWVTAKAPGVDHRSDYPADVEFVYGPDQTAANPERAAFDGFALWSGTSFAAPYVAAELIRFGLANGVTPREAWMKLRSGECPVAFPLDGGPCHDRSSPQQAGE
jgi:hypothetical protein